MTAPAKPTLSDRILADPANLTCTCPEVDCRWHCNCRDCMALHRYHATIPNCLEIVMAHKQDDR